MSCFSYYGTYTVINQNVRIWIHRNVKKSCFNIVTLKSFNSEFQLAIRLFCLVIYSVLYECIYTYSLTTTGPFGGSCQIHGPIPSLTPSESVGMTAVPDLEVGPSGIKSPILTNPGFSHTKCPPRVHRSCFCVQFIADHTKMQEDSTKVIQCFA